MDRYFVGLRKGPWTGLRVGAVPLYFYVQLGIVLAEFDPFLFFGPFFINLFQIVPLCTVFAVSILINIVLYRLNTTTSFPICLILLWFLLTEFDVNGPDEVDQEEQSEETEDEDQGVEELRWQPHYLLLL